LLASPRRIITYSTLMAPIEFTRLIQLVANKKVGVTWKYRSSSVWAATNAKVAATLNEARDLGDLLAAVKAGLGVSALPFIPSLYGLASPINVQQLPVLPDVRISIRTAANVESHQVEWLIQLIRRCWDSPEQQKAGAVPLQVPCAM